jgi:hypothetical protein
MLRGLMFVLVLIEGVNPFESPVYPNGEKWRGP